MGYVERELLNDEHHTKLISIGMIFSRLSYILLRGSAKIQTLTSLGCCSRRNWWSGERVQMSREAAKFNNFKRTRGKRAPLPDRVTYQRCKRILIER